MIEFAPRNANYEQEAQIFVEQFDVRRSQLAAEGIYRSCALEDLNVSPERLQRAKFIVGLAIAESPPELRALTDGMPGTRMHQDESGVMAVLHVEEMDLGKDEGLSEYYQKLAAKIAINHDNGKSAEELQDLVNSSERFTTPDQYKKMARHAVIGAENARDCGAEPEVVVGILLHHANVITTGPEEAPNQLHVSEELSRMCGEVLASDKNIPFVYAANIIADIYSALSSTGEGRAYKPMETDIAKKVDIVSHAHQLPVTEQYDPMAAVCQIMRLPVVA